MAVAYEVNFDGLVGPTHNYAGLSPGNLASQAHKHSVSHPRAAALEGLAKMKLLVDLGLKQGVLPPHERPHLALLHELGLSNVEAAHAQAPHLLAAAYSASSMWAANAATVCPSPDGTAGRVVFVPANLVSEIHRGIEAEQTTRILRCLFADPRHFEVQPPLSANFVTRDEGAANHSRFCTAYGEPGVHLFVYSEPGGRHPSRQSLTACQALARRFGLDGNAAVLAQQNPEVVDAGVFHNDVIAVGNLDLLFYHEDAWVDTDKVVERLRQAFAPLRCICIRRAQLPVAEAVSSYLFNSQLIQLPDGGTALICPQECRASARVQSCLSELEGIDVVHYAEVRQSMRNGGGPACLRLRVVLTEAQWAAVHAGVVLTEKLYDKLVTWVQQYYREQLSPDDLADPHLVGECHAALDSLTKILGLGAIYPFQR